MVKTRFSLLSFAILLSVADVLGRIDVLKEATIKKSESEELLVTVALHSFLKGEEGPPPQAYSGPVTGYVLEGEFLFQVQDGPIQILIPEEKFYVDDGSVQIWGGNGSNSTMSKVIVCTFGKMGQPVATPLDHFPRESYDNALKMAIRSI